MSWRDKIAKAITGIKAYHSSPHDFDKFDLSKIGTGEGAQSYGHGLYFAENPAVSGHGGEYWKQFSQGFSPDELAAGKYLSQHGFDRDKAITTLQRDAGYTRGDFLAKNLGTPSEAKIRAAIAAQDVQLELLRSGKQLGPRTYEVNINADPAKMLDWDKPIRQQPHIMDFIDNKWGDPDIVLPRMGVMMPNAPGRDFHYGMAGVTQRPEAVRNAASALNEAGIPGIKYLDEGSRGRQHSNAGSIWQEPLTRNYVVFDPSIVDITKKYAVPGAIAAPALGALAQQDQYEAVP